MLLQTSIKSLELLKGQKEISHHFRGRAVLIVAYTAANLPEVGLQQFALRTNIDVIEQANQVITSILLDNKVSVELLDLALEGISALWVKYPYLLVKDSSKTEKIFNCITESIASPDV